MKIRKTDKLQLIADGFGVCVNPFEVCDRGPYLMKSFSSINFVAVANGIQAHSSTGRGRQATGHWCRYETPATALARRCCTIPIATRSSATSTARSTTMAYPST